MTPSLPLSWFNYCLIPEHDHPAPVPNVIITRGALTNVTPSAAHDARKGLILIGGPSSHFHWDSKTIATQVDTLVRVKNEIDWTLTTSRRTPDDFLKMLQSDQINVIPSNKTHPGWVENQLEHAGQTWVTPDSASMLYEALTSGCKVGTFDLEPVKRSRVANGIQARIAENSIATISNIMKPNPLITSSASAGTFNEAERCAKLILARLQQ
jgi:mitochondrial fission protein ELM1